MELALTRRRLLQSVALVGVSACTSERDATVRSTTTTPGGPSTSAAATTTTTTIDPAALLERRLERATFGATPALRGEVDAAGGFDAWLDAQLAPDGLSPTPTFAGLSSTVERRLPTLADLRFESQQERNDATRLSLQTITARTVFGAAFAPDQVRQRLTDALADLLHVSSAEQPEVFGICDYDRVLRDGAFGRFADLLLATARHAAMLVFLDNGTSRADGGRVPNENYARELMELHTVGVDGGYDEGDVVELAHLLSGWSVERRTRAYRFRPDWHDLGPLTAGGDVLGWRPEDGQVGEAAGEAFFEHLAHHPATARRIAHVLARRFVSEAIARDHPLVVEAAEVYLTADTALGPVVRHLLTSEHFGAAATLMVRRPIDLVAHSLRVTDAGVDPADLDTTLQLLVGLQRVLGQVPYGWPAPDGYPWSSAAWSNAGALIARWNGLVSLAAGGARGVVLHPAAMGATDPTELVAALCGPAHQLF